MSEQLTAAEALRDELRAVAQSLLADPRIAAPASPADPLTFPTPPAALLAETGWLGLEVDVDLGGSEVSMAETLVVCEEMGRALCRAPYLGTAVLGVGALLTATSHPRRDDLLRRAVVGHTELALALPQPHLQGMSAPFRAEPAKGGHRLAGQLDAIVDADRCDYLLLPVDTPDGELALACVSRGLAGVSVVSTPVLDLTRTVATVEVDGAVIDGDALWSWRQGSSAPLQHLADRAALALAADSLGLLTAALERTVAYAKERKQFGRFIGTFQAVKHACADMLTAQQMSRALLDEAIDGYVSDAPNRTTSISMAKSYIDEAAVAAAGKAMQLHGGIGYTWEAGFHAYLKRAAMNRSLYGTPLLHRARIARALGDSSGGAGG